MRALVVDDDRDFADALADMLELFGVEAKAVYNCDEAFAVSKEESFGLALVDVGLASTNGVDCARELRRMLPGVTCVLMSGYSAAAIVEMGVSAEEFATLHKPIRPEELAPYLDL